MKFYLGSHLPQWLGRTGVPLFISAIRLRQRKSPWPKALGKWALDSGGFSELQQHGRWTVGPEWYIAEIRKWQLEIGNLEWAAAQDWMCEPLVIHGGRVRDVMFAGTGLSVEEHQRRTVANFLDLRRLGPELPIVPVIQGFEYADYFRCVEMYQAAGVDLKALPLVGLGTVCRREKTAMAAELVRDLARTGLRLHLFGFKVEGLRNCSRYATSADSMAWSYAARSRANGARADSKRRAMQAAELGMFANVG